MATLPGVPLYEVPFSMEIHPGGGSGAPSAESAAPSAEWAAPSAERRTPIIVRGSIDCLIQKPDGSITVVEFKTGRPRPSHERQLGLYVAAARMCFPDTMVDGTLIYP